MNTMLILLAAVAGPSIEALLTFAVAVLVVALLFYICTIFTPDSTIRAIIGAILLIILILLAIRYLF
jgi:hypothetical protein